MPLLATNTNPTDRQLRQFGFVAFALIIAATWWITRSTSSTTVAVIAAAVFATIGIIRPRILRPVFVLMVLVTMPISYIMGELILLAVYFGIFFPLATVFRIIGRDPLMRRQSQESNTYWQQRQDSSSAESYFRQS